MKSQPAVPSKGHTDKTLEPRKPYATPILTVYGSVTKLTQGASGTGPDTGVAGMNMPSDPIAKQDVVRVGTHPLGLGLYLFTYRPQFQAAYGAGRQFGVMADEVEAVLPAAVSINAQGIRQVNYAKLGIRLTH